MTEPPVLLLHLYSETARKQILKRLKAERRPRDTQVFLGTYGISPEDADAIKNAAILDVHYAPTFHLARGVAEDKLLRKRPRPPAGSPPLDQKFAGPIPVHSQGRLLPTSLPRLWGIELGRRFRDQLRTAQKTRPSIVCWQLDEIPPEIDRKEDARAPQFRAFVGGVVRGLAEGRLRLGDKVLPGFVWVSAKALNAMPGLSLADRSVQKFWEDLDAGAKCLVGEEYPRFFKLKEAAMGKSLAAPQTALRAPGNTHRKALADRYIVGMTPGWQKPDTSGLGGVVDSKELAVVTAWRNKFIAARAKAQKPRGYGMYYFNETNIVPLKRIDNAIASLHVAARRHMQPPLV